MNSSFNPCIIIPVYNHGPACIHVVEKLAKFNIPVILVDDGNAEETRYCLYSIKENHTNLVDLVILAKNSGKGGAFKAGIIFAHKKCYTHALQIDADGQHDTERVPFFLEKSAAAPDKMICGYPEYDESAPGKRKNGRKFANNWCKIVTWSGGITDSMCGFRLYPVEFTYNYLTRHSLDLRMGFDIEILVKLIWAGLPYDFHSVKVTYPSDGISNFHMFRDNVRISWVFTKLCCGMFIRIPKLIWQKLK